MMLAHHPETQWAVDELVARFGGRVFLSDVASNGQYVGVRPGYGVFLRCPDGVGERGFEVITRPRLDALIQRVEKETC